VPLAALFSVCLRMIKPVKIMYNRRERLAALPVFMISLVGNLRR